MRAMRNVHDTQPSPGVYLRGPDSGLRAPPRLLFWGVILFFLFIILGIAAAIFGFREVLQPAQQQRVIDQLPFMRMFRNPTPMGGVFPTIVPSGNADEALALLDMPLNIPSPVGTTSPEIVVAPHTPSPVPPAATSAPTQGNSQSPAAVDALPTIPIATVAQSVPLTESNTRLPHGDVLPASARISGIVHQQQTWNNCGPATITMALSYYGWTRDQAFAASVLKPNREDKNVSPHELADFVEAETFVNAIVRMGGSLDLLKRLVANNFPVIIETGAMFEAYDWIGHYRALIAYDDAYELFYFFDSFLGVGDAAQGVVETYARVDGDWQAFNRTFIVVYEPQREAVLRNLLGEYWDEDSAAQIAFETAQSEARREPQNGFAWFNMGTSLVALGRYHEAATAFDQAHRTERLPWRIHWYQFGAFEAYFKVGRYDDVLSLVQINQNNARVLEETYYWQGRVQEAQGSPQQAAASFRRALSYNPNYHDARKALDSLN